MAGYSSPQTYTAYLLGGISRVLGILSASGLFWMPAHQVLGQSLAAANSSDDSLRREFLSPPESAKPRVWWHWMNGNITKEGIKRDLEWMRRIGLGGVQNFDAGHSTPQVVGRRLVYMTAPWQDAFRYTTRLANQLGLELAIAGSPGFSESGGPWVKPQDGMKKLVWCEIQVIGGVPFSGELPHPPTVIGPFQNVPIDRSGILNPPAQGTVNEVYADIAILAYRLPTAERSMAALNPMVTTSGGSIDASRLWNGDFTHPIRLPYGSQSNPAWIQFDFGHPQAIQSMTLGLIENYWDLVGRQHVGAQLEASADGVRFSNVAIDYDSTDQSLAADVPPLEQTVTFPAVTARYFRLLLPTPIYPPISPEVANGFGFGEKPTEHQVTQLVLHVTPRVDHFEQKAGFFLDAGIKAPSGVRVADVDVLRRREIINLTSRVRPDGTLTWTPPPGHWGILRVGYSLLGVTNHPASPEGTGLEVDKLSRASVKAHMDNYLGRYESVLGRALMGQSGLRAMVNDSWEAGPQNWTPELPAEFARRRGYDLLPWLPALTGRIIDSAEETDRFLWDFRRTLGELLAENHYDQIATLLHAHHMIHYGEAHEVARAFIGDGMDAKRADDIPMGAMWMRGFLVDQTDYDADIRESASVAHIYGQNLVAAESMTALGIPGSAYAFAPETLKPIADRELADGVNRFVVHTSVHQPLNRVGPGVTLGPFGQWFTRQETWAEQASPWVTYLSRSSYLLQQGHFVADVVYFYGQDSNVTALYGHRLPPVPEGYAFDFASAHALTRLAVRDGMLVTASGMRYRVLVLDPRTRYMSLDVLRGLAYLVEAGATVIGNKPQSSPSLADVDHEFRAIADAIWGTDSVGEHHYGKGVVLSGKSLAESLAELKLQPDFCYVKSRPGTTVWFVHRRLDDGDLYFVNNRQARPERIKASFRVSGKAAEIWHADTGVTEQASYRMQGGRTVVPLQLDPHDALFVVFRKPTEQRRRTLPAPSRYQVTTVGGPWIVRFQPGLGAPEQATFAHLHSWSVNADPRIRYFSGTANYDATLNVPYWWFHKGEHLEIDLGVVKSLAEVVVNDQSVGAVWKAPFRVDVTGALRPGANRLTIRVTNLWPNRLIGDKQPNAVGVAFTTFNPYTANSHLLDAGLLGPVTVQRVEGAL